MDSLAILPALLVLMLVALAVLGYALHRLAAANTHGDPPLPLDGPCPRCGQRLDAGWMHCPMCGAAL